MNTSSASGRLRAILSLVEAGPHGATAALWRADRPRERYLAYLVTMHQVIRASVPLMERAADLADRAAPCGADPLAAPSPGTCAPTSWRRPATTPGCWRTWPPPGWTRGP